MGLSNKDEEANPLEELRHTTSTTNIKTTSSPTRHKVSMQGRHPGIQLIYHTQQTTNTTFRDRHPDVPPLELEPQRRTTQSPSAQVALRKSLVDHGRHTNI
jgi:hypothetical protein